MSWRARKPRNGAGKGVSLAFLLTLWYTSAAFLVVVAAISLFYFSLAQNLRKISEQLLADETEVCRTLLLEHGRESHALHEEVEVDSAVRRYQKFYVRVLDPSGVSLSTTPGMDADLNTRRVFDEAGKHRGIFRIDSPSGGKYRAVVSPVDLDPEGKDTWILQVAVDLSQEQVVLGGQLVWVWALLAASLIVCPVIGYAIAHRSTRPLREVAETATHIGSSTLNERIAFRRYPTEVRLLATAFNAMLERLEESFERLSRFSADIAHELRTPVNNIRGESEVALARSRTPEQYRDVIESCLEESVRLTELIEALLFLARAESPGDHIRRTREDLRNLITDVCDYYEAAAAEQGVSLLADLPDEPLPAYVDRVLLQRALGNLITNSLAHSSPGGTVLIAAFIEDEHIRVEVRDTGTGIDAEALPRVFDRLYRGDSARSRNSGGAGLGLSIVRQIVLLHNGVVQVSSDVGRGTTVAILLDRAGGTASPARPPGAFDPAMT